MASNTSLCPLIRTHFDALCYTGLGEGPSDGEIRQHVLPSGEAGRTRKCPSADAHNRKRDEAFNHHHLSTRSLCVKDVIEHSDHRLPEEPP